MFKHTLGGIAAAALMFASVPASADPSGYPSSVSEAPAFSFPAPDTWTGRTAGGTGNLAVPSSPSEAPAFTFSAQRSDPVIAPVGGTGSLPPSAYAPTFPHSVNETGRAYQPMM